MDLKILDYPAISSDFNPIENVWRWLKNKLGEEDIFIDINNMKELWDLHEKYIEKMLDLMTCKVY